MTLTDVLQLRARDSSELPRPGWKPDAEACRSEFFYVRAKLLRKNLSAPSSVASRRCAWPGDVCQCHCFFR